MQRLMLESQFSIFSLKYKDLTETCNDPEIILTRLQQMLKDTYH